MTDTIAITESEDFRPRFDDISKDMDRMMEHAVELLHQGRIAQVPGKSLDDAYLVAARRRLIHAYWDRRLYAAIETHYTYTFEIAFGWPHHEMMDDLERFVAASEGQRAIRIWRNYLALIKPIFWSRIDERKRGFRMAKYWAAPEAVQRNSYAKLLAPIPEYRETLLKMYDHVSAFFVRAGATEVQMARLEAERAEIAAEERAKPGKPDPRAMDEDVFWEVIGTPADGTLSERIDTLPDRLARFKAMQIRAFDALLHQMDHRAYRSDIWALAHLLNDGCGDDAFEGFRCGLIMLGRADFEAVLADPDAFDTRKVVGDGLALMDVPPLAYEMRAGKAMKRKAYRRPALSGPDLDEDAFADHLPRVAAAVSA